jgi:hypothetical protein
MAYLMMLQVATAIQCQAAVLRDFKLKRMWKQRTTQHFKVPPQNVPGRNQEISIRIAVALTEISTVCLISKSHASWDSLPHEVSVGDYIKAYYLGLRAGNTAYHNSFWLVC